MIQTTETVTETAATPATRVRNATKAAKNARASQPAKAKKKATKEDSALAAEIVAAATCVPGIEMKEFGNEERPSVVLRIPAWSAVKKTLDGMEDQTLATMCAKTFHALRDAVETLCGDANATVVIHASGSFALYGKLKG